MQILIGTLFKRYYCREGSCYGGQHRQLFCGNSLPRFWGL